MAITKGTLFQRGKKWQWKCRKDGGVHWETFPEKVRTARDAELYRAKRLALYESNTAAFGVKATITELCDRYETHAVEYYRRDGQPTTTIFEVRAVLTALRAHSPKLNAGDFTPTRLKALRDKWIAAGLARATVNTYVGRVVAIFKWGVSEEMIPPAVYHTLACVERLKAGRSAAQETEPRTPAPESHIELTKKQLPSVLCDLIDLQLFTAARPGEVVTLRAVDIDTTGRIWETRLIRHKTAHKGKSRTLYFGPQAQAILRRRMASKPMDAYLFSPRDAIKERTAKEREGPGRRENQKQDIPKTDRRVGECYTVCSFRKAVERACSAANDALREKGEPEFPVWSPNRLRHNAATKVRKQFGLEAAQVFLGHSCADVTEVYAERDEDQALIVAERLG